MRGSVLRWRRRMPLPPHPHRRPIQRRQRERKLSQEIGRIIMLPENQERIAREGSAARKSTPEAFEKLVRDEIVMRAKIFKAAGSKAN
jgi:tripartite-type tricarboxylate transporter receptor subunit TctC